VEIVKHQLTQALLPPARDNLVDCIRRYIVTRGKTELA
jgi:hypothetical protein